MPERLLLWVEDRKDLICSQRPKLRKIGFSVHWAFRPRTVLRALERYSVSVVFFDLVLLVAGKEIDWQKFFLRIRHKDPTVPIAAVTAYEERYRDQIALARFDRVYPKPIPSLLESEKEFNEFCADLESIPFLVGISSGLS